MNTLPRPLGPIALARMDAHADAARSRADMLAAQARAVRAQVIAKGYGSKTELVATWHHLRFEAASAAQVASLLEHEAANAHAYAASERAWLAAS